MVLESFANKYSWKCMLGPTCKDISEHNEIYHWKLNNRTNLIFGRELVLSDLELLKSFVPFSFYYAEDKNIKFLSNYFNISKSKEPSVGIDLQKLDISGRKNHGIRYAINKSLTYNLKEEDDYRDFKDIKEMLDIWSDTAGYKYFRDFTGKNRYFFGNKLHKDCINIFLYDGDYLVSFGVLSPPIEGYSAYIIGKALYYRYPGLSDYTDYMLYQKAIKAGVTHVNLAGGLKKVLKFKLKFPGSYIINEYDGIVNNAKI